MVRSGRQKKKKVRLRESGTSEEAEHSLLKLSFFVKSSSSEV